MINDGLVYLFFGIVDEYVLNPLYVEMKQRGYTCIELDIAKEKYPKKIIENLKSDYADRIVFVTSAHLFLDKKNMDLQRRFYDEVLSPLEIIDYLKPIKNVYYPHDLGDGFTHYDRNWFSLFDIYLSPLPVNAHGGNFCEIVDVGWIKKNKPTPPLHDGAPLFGHAFSETIFYYTKGADYFYKTFEEIWSLGVKVKLINNHTVPVFSKVLDFHNVSYYDASINIFDLIDNCSVVVTNALTSVNLEAALSGRMVINLLDGVYKDSYQRSQLSGFPNLFCVTIEEGAQMIREIQEGKREICAGKDIMGHFDFDLAIRKIVENN